MKRIVLIGDIVASKKIKNRYAVQKKISILFKRMTVQRNVIISPYTITLGDEFQAVYSNADVLFKDIWRILSVLYPERARFSVGIGEISTGINKKQAIGMDGPAFYEARAGLVELKENSRLFNVTCTGLKDIELAKYSLFLLSHSIEKWKIKRIQIFNLLFNGIAVKKISAELKISDKAVYKNIDTGGMNLIIEILDRITEVINNSAGGK